MKVTLLLAAGLISFNALAADNNWTGSVEVGYKDTSGDGKATNTTMDLKATANKKTENWRHILELTASLTETDTSDVADDSVEAADGDTSEVTDKKQGILGRSEYIIAAPGYLFGQVKYKTDEFGDIEKSTSESIGYGYGILATDDMTLNVELGAGAKQFTNNGAKDSESEAVYTFAANYTWQVNATSTFKEELTSEFTDTLTTYQSTTSIILQVAGNLSTSLSLIKQWDERDDEVTDATFKSQNQDIIARLIYSY